MRGKVDVARKDGSRNITTDIITIVPSFLDIFKEPIIEHIQGHGFATTVFLLVLRGMKEAILLSPGIGIDSLFGIFRCFPVVLVTLAAPNNLIFHLPPPSPNLTLSTTQYACACKAKSTCRPPRRGAPVAPSSKPPRFGVVMPDVWCISIMSAAYWAARRP